MLALLNKKFKKPEACAAEKDVLITPMQPAIDESSLKRSMKEKLQSYKPVEKEAKFTGPQIF